MDIPPYLTAKWIPLTKTAAIKTAIFLWYNEDIRCLEYPLQKRTIKRVEEKIEKLKLPKILKRQLENIVGPIGDHISAWMTRLGGLMVQLNLPKFITWKATGTIDSRRTAEKAIRIGVLDDITAFRLASCNCVVDQLFRLWPAMEGNDRGTIPWDRYETLMRAEREEVQFWIAYMTHDVERWMDRITDNAPGFHSPHYTMEFAFLRGLKNGNDEFGNYHMDRLDVTEKEEIFVNAMESELIDPKKLFFHPSHFYRILCHMYSEERSEVLDEYPTSVLLMLLQWPLQDFFLDTSLEIGHLLHELDFVFVLSTVGHYAFRYENNKLYKDIFVKFWDGANESQREHFILGWIFVKFLRLDLDEIGLCFGLSDFRTTIIETMFRNGYLVFDVTVGYCILDILESIVIKYFKGKTVLSLKEIQSVNVKLKYNCTCCDWCNPDGFYSYIMEEIDCKRWVIADAYLD